VLAGRATECGWRNVFAGPSTVRLSASTVRVRFDLCDGNGAVLVSEFLRVRYTPHIYV
jgi:hypothetical protein